MTDWDQGSDGEQDDKDKSLWGGQVATIFLVEATKAMFRPDLNDETYFGKCIESCKEFLLRQIRSNTKGPTAIVLFGTKEGTDAWNNVKLLLELSPASADRVKSLIKILESDDYDDFQTKFGHSDNFSMANALWYCHHLLSDYKQKLSTKHIIVMTCTDNPHSNDPNMQRQARQRAVTLNDTDITLSVIPLGPRFNKEAFYSELVLIANGQSEEEEMGVEDPSEHLDDIINRVCQCSSQKRSIARISWHLGKDVKLSVAVYNLVQPARIPTRQRLYRKTNDEVQARPQFFNATTGEVVINVKDKRVVEYGDRKVTFDKNEWTQAKQVAKNGIILLGFKPKKCVKYFVQKSSFVYPENQLIKGSRALFAAIHQRCIARDVVPICYFAPRKISKPRIVALWPQEEKLNDRGFQIAPAGFHVHYLPYANHFRDLSSYIVQCGTPNLELMEIAREIVRKLSFDYDPFMIGNPKLQTHWAYIEALALNLEETREVPDLTAPDLTKMGEALGDLSERFNELAFGRNFDPESIVRAKTKRAETGFDRPAKKPKMDLASSSMEDIAKAGEVDKLKVDELKQYLREKTVYFPSSAKKADLVELVYGHVGLDQL